jgi:peptidoglycan hydrolase-like protein with peptidoglycan-binding domain
VPNMREGLLALRFDPTMSIVTGAEYGLDNLNALIKDKLVDSNIGDDDRAWHIYLAHHEGLAGAEHFLRNDQTIPFDKLVQQVGLARANQLVFAAGGDVTIAYRKWLTDFMEQKIQPSRFRLGKAPSGTVIAPTARALGKFQGTAIAFDTLAGERPDLVLETQQILSNLGYLDPPSDGFMGPTTRWAITEFCKLNGLSTTGGLTKNIAAALLSPHQLLPEIRPCGQWIDRIIAYMQKKNYFICRHPDCKNIVYVEGVDADGSLNPQTPNAFEDLRIVFSIGPDGKPLIQPWVATTEPGKPYVMNPMNPKGAACIAIGQYKSWAVGTHVGASGKDPHEALIQCAPIDVYRDSKKDFKREGPIYTGIFGVNQHWGYDQPKDDVGTASAGCLVGEKRDGHRAFMAVVKSDPRFRANNGYKFVTAVIPGHEALAPSA